MFDTPVKDVMKRRNLLRAAPATLVDNAARRMSARGVGAIMVVERGALVGIFTERDIVTRVVAPGLDPHATRLADVMTRAPQTIEPDRPFGLALRVMQENGFRHLPVVVDGKPVGIVSSRTAMDPELEEFVAEANRRKHFEEAP